MDMEGVLGDILSMIFAPDGFYTEDLSECKRGLLPLSRISTLFGKTYGSEIVVKILTELKLGVVMQNDGVIQIPALLRDIDIKSSILKDDKKYAQYAGLRFKLTSNIDIFSYSAFPKIQVTMLKEHGEMVKLWTHGLCCIIDRVHVVVYMSDDKQFIDVIVRSEKLNAEGCYFVREKVGEVIEDELWSSSSGTEFLKQIICPVDLINNSDSSTFSTYDLSEVYDHYYRNEPNITPDGVHTDSVQELLFCNYIKGTIMSSLFCMCGNVPQLTHYVSPGLYALCIVCRCGSSASDR